MTNLELYGDVAVVVGGGGGIGRAISHALARHGLSVHVADRDLAAARTVAEAITASGHTATAHQVDVADLDGVEALFASLAAAGQSPDVMVNASGLIAYAPMADLAPDRLRAMVDVNVLGAFHCVRAAGRHMAERRGGRIITIASTASFVAPRLAATAYSMTKGAVRQLTVAAAAELAPYGVLVNAVAPGTTRTAFVQGTLDTPEQLAAASARVPLGRVGEPADIVGPVLFFASRLADFVTGQVLLVDGGLTTRAG